MIKFIATVNKHPSMTDEEFVRYWRARHAPLARDIPGLRRYTISRVVGTPDGRRPYDGVAELFFDDVESFRSGFASPAGALARDDMAQFTDPARITRAFTIEERILWNE